MNTITMKVEYITPEIAKNYLERNINNRGIDNKKVLDYACQMNKDNWRLSPEGISFDKLGRLIDGQHRLLAVIKANMTIPFMVTKGFDEDVFKVINTGKNRSAKDVFEIEQIPDAKAVAAGLKSFVNLKKNFSLNITNSRDLNLSNIDILNIYNEDANLYHDISTKSQIIYKKLRLLTRAEIFSFSVYLIKVKNYSPDIVYRFFNEFNTYSENNTVNLFRERLIKDKSSRISEMKPIHKRALFVKTWNAFITGKEIKSLKHNPETEKFPEFI